jgi:hypothetical protein
MGELWTGTETKRMQQTYELLTSKKKKKKAHSLESTTSLAPHCMHRVATTTQAGKNGCPPAAAPP